MHFDGALRKAMAAHLGVPEFAIGDAEVIYTPGGDDYDPTYGGSTYTDPSFNVRVTLTTGTVVEADLEFTLTALLRMTLGLPQ